MSHSPATRDAAVGLGLGGLLGATVGYGVGSGAVGNFLDPKAPPIKPPPDNSDDSQEEQSAEESQQSVRGQAADMLSGGGPDLDSSKAMTARNVLLGS